MKNKLLIMILICTIVLVIVVTLCIIFGPKKVKISDLTRMSLSYSSGYAMYSYTTYNLEYKDDKYVVTIKPYGVSEDAKQTKYVDEEFVKKIEDILSKYDVGSWDGFNKSDSGVLDGDGFSFSAGFKDGSSISAHGYMRWPKNYREVRKELYNLFDELYDLDRVYEY